MVRKGNLAVFESSNISETGEVAIFLSLSLSLSLPFSFSYFVNMPVHVHLYLLYFLLFSFPSLSSVILPSPPPLRLGYTVLLQTQEGKECPQMKSLLNDRLDYYPITTPVSYTPRLFHLSSSTGWFRAIEETHIACPEDMSLVPDHFPFIQETVYNAVQPGTRGHILIVSNIRRILF